MYHFKGSLTVGQINRFLVEIDHDQLPQNVDADTLEIRVKNTTSALMRPALLAGPYVLYTSIKEQSYHHDTALGKGDFAPHFDANLKTNCSRWQTLPIVPPSDKDLESRTFVIDVASQVIFSPSATVYFELTIGRDKKEVRHAVQKGSPIDATISGLRVRMEDTSTIWGMPPVQRDHPGHHFSNHVPPSETNTIQMDAVTGKAYDHLVVLTHGIHSNLTTDLLYMKEMIEKTARKQGDRVICKGFAGNACNTEKGVKWLAENVGEWVLRETGWKVTDGPHRTVNPYKKISFIAHSLGGLVQIYALGYLHDKTLGRIFDPTAGGLRPVNFVTLATPWLGISAENPAYVKLALDFGFLGKTGQDLALTSKPLGEYNVHDPRHAGTGEPVSSTIESTKTPTKVRSRAPLMSLLSRKSAPSHIAIRLFETRTVYANIENDGIVPLRTSSLYFLDWEGFSAQKAKVQKRLTFERSTQHSRSPDASDSRSGNTAYAMHSDHDNERDSSRLNHPSHEAGPRHSHDMTEYSSSDEEEEREHEKHEQASGVGTNLANADPDCASASTPRAVLDKPFEFSQHAESIQLPATVHTVDTHMQASDRLLACQGLQPDPTSSPGEETPQGAADVVHSPTSKLRSVAHALGFGLMIRRVSNSRDKILSLAHHGHTEAGAGAGSKHHAETFQQETPTSSPQATKSSSKMASGPSDETEDNSHANGGLMSLIKPSQSHRKPSKAFARSQTVPKDNEAHEEKVHPEEPSRTSFIRSLESVLNPPMPELDYITDPSTREPAELVIVHDKLYYPDDIPPLKQLPRRNSMKNQSRHERREEDKERVRLEKIRLEEKIARCWHEDMTWRKVLVKLRPDAHNNISKFLLPLLL